MTWKVHWDDIVWFPNTKLRSSFHSTGSLPRRGSMTVSEKYVIEQMESSYFLNEKTNSELSLALNINNNTFVHHVALFIVNVRIM